MRWNGSRYCDNACRQRAYRGRMADLRRDPEQRSAYVARLERRAAEAQEWADLMEEAAKILSGRKRGSVDRRWRRQRPARLVAAAARNRRRAAQLTAQAARLRGSPDA